MFFLLLFLSFIIDEIHLFTFFVLNFAVHVLSCLVALLAQKGDRKLVPRRGQFHEQAF